MLVFILYLFLTIGLLMLIGLLVSYSTAVVSAPFVNLYNAIKEKDYKFLFAMLFFIICISLFAWVITI